MYRRTSNASTSSAIASSPGGKLRPNASAVLRVTTNSNLVDGASKDPSTTCPKPPLARLLKAQISERADRRREMRLPGLSIYLACAAMLFPQPAAGQRAFAVESDVTVRADSFACKETSELDRLLQRNQSGGFTSGTQLYDYLKAHKCIGLTAGRARVYSTQGQYVCIYEPKNNKMSFYPCAWTRREMLSQ